MATSDQPASSTPWHPSAAVASWLIPGAGHILLGHRKRGMIIGLTIGLLWLSGWAIGGVSIFNYNQHRAWFGGQMLTAPSVAVAVARDHLLTEAPPERPAAISEGFSFQPPKPKIQYEPSFGRVNEIGILYTALAGLLNLLAIIDVLYKEPSA